MSAAKPTPYRPGHCIVCFRKARSYNEHSVCARCQKLPPERGEDERDPMLSWDTGHSGGDR